MTIENLVNIIGGELVNSPKITKIESATIYPSKVDSGDLYFACDLQSIQKAVDNGAYAIVFEGDVEITDPEIAYIKVESIKSATVNFLRYVVLQKESKIFYFKDIEISLLKSIVSRRSSIYSILTNDWQKSFEAVLNSDYEIYITSSKELANSISPNFLELEESVNGYIISDTLLRTTFKIEKYVYQNAELTPIFFENLKKVVKFCQKNEADYDINRLKYTKEFKPFYVEKNLTPANKGTTEQVLIFVNDLKTVDLAIEYLRKQSKWIKSIALTPPKNKLETIEKPFWYNNTEEAKQILKQEHYNFAFCYRLAPEEILNRDSYEGSLF